MKARVKGTTDIIEVEFNKDALNACYPPYYDKEHHMYYQPEQLEWVDYEANAEPDYWEKLKHQYAGMAMQGIVMNEKMQYDLYQAFGKNSAMKQQQQILIMTFVLLVFIIIKIMLFL